jgi:hypothetical protein
LPPPSQYLLYENGQFVDHFATSGLQRTWCFGVAAGDFDNDMDVDLYLVNSGGAENMPNDLYENQGNGSFVRVPGAGGAAGSTLGIGESASVADYNEDGFLDLLVTNGKSKAPFDEEGPVQLFRNQGNGNHWLEIDLVGTASNRDAVGARLIATAGGIAQLREQNGIIRYRAQDFHRVHFGLGSHTQADYLTIYWTSGIVQELFNVPADQIIRVVERRTGDVNGDHCVDDHDFAAVIFAFGQTGSELPEDLNGDGIVDDADLALLIFHFGEGC